MSSNLTVFAVWERIDGLEDTLVDLYTNFKAANARANTFEDAYVYEETVYELYEPPQVPTREELRQLGRTPLPYEATNG